MVDTDTFLTTLYVMVDDFCKSQLSPEKRPGPEASLAVVRWSPWPSLPSGDASVINETSTGTPSVICVPTFPPCRTALSSIACCGVIGMPS